MIYKLRHVTVLLFALFLGAAAMYVEIDPWVRVLVAAFLLVPIVYAADGLGIAQTLNVLPDPRIRHRRFSVLRSEVKQLLDVVRRLNWLIFDLKRRVRNEDDVKAEIALAEERLGEILDEIRNSAGRLSAGDIEVDSDELVENGSADSDAQ